MSLIQALVLGLVQGATEFLPVSSSGHLVLVPWLLGWHDVGESNLAFDTLVHWGTLVAVLGYFWKDLWRILGAVWNGIRSRDLLGEADARLGWFIVVGSIPAVLVGFFLNDWFERAFGNPMAAAWLLFGTAGLLFLSERAGRRYRGLDSMDWGDAIWVGLAQALAILPGISRSGSTISAALLRGMKREDAARYSFLLGVPAVLGAGAWQLIKLFQSGAISEQLGSLLVGFASSAVVGLLAIHLLLLFVRKRPLYLFGVYCVLFGGFSLIVYGMR